MRHSESPLAAALYLNLLDPPFLYHPLLHEPACAAGITHKTGYITQWKLGGHVCLSDHPRAQLNFDPAAGQLRPSVILNVAVLLCAQGGGRAGRVRARDG